uniref:Uncharacterized protein n=1 Tax=Arundo donax TaxID=35708 RepID=A0A0A9DT98_ARUDO
MRRELSVLYSRFCKYHYIHLVSSFLKNHSSRSINCNQIDYGIVRCARACFLPSIRYY